MKEKPLKILISFLSILIVPTLQTMLITSPAINPFDNSTIPFSYSNIGSIPYGKTLTFDLVSPNNLDLCISTTVNSSHFTTPTYLLIDKSLGTCSYTTQAINAQYLGAKGVVFVSDVVNYYDKIVQVDDGNGRKVHITVLFVSTQTYRQLSTIKNIHIKVQFETHQSAVVNMTYFLSASGRANYIFLRQFKPFFTLLKDYINFKPSYLTIKCPHCQMTECLISKDYCIFEMDQYQDHMGEFILREQLRQFNLWKVYGSQKYFNYMNLFDNFCDGNWVGSQDCGDGVIQQLGLEKKSMEIAPTQLMDEWRIEQVAAGFLSTPEITINSQLYVGSYNPQQIFTAICQSLTNPPQACTGINPSTQSNQKILWIIAAILLACLFTSLITYFIYKKCVKQELTSDIYSKVNQLVAKYATEVDMHNRKRKDRTRMRLNDQL